MDLFLRKAWEKGIVLGGISAGAICWYEEGVTDSIPGTMTALKGLGMISGSHCPHYCEKERRLSYHRLIKKGMKEGIAADDHVALHYIDDKLANVVRAVKKGFAFRVSRKGEKVIEEKIKPENL